MKTSYQKFMASNAVAENTNVELGAVKVDLGIKEEMAKIQARLVKQVKAGKIKKKVAEETDLTNEEE